LFDEGFREAAKFKKVPLQTLLDLTEEFRSIRCKNEWLHKRKQFKEHDLSVALNCYFTTNDFVLKATIKRISTKETLCEGVLLRTDPYEVCFQGLFKDILIKGKKIIVTDAGDSQKFLIDLEKAENGVFDFETYDILRQRRIRNPF
jgi:hypothetical protein